MSSGTTGLRPAVIAWLRFASTVVLLLLATSLPAQRFDDAITVTVVDVPVYVENAGRPVEGLTRNDFELFVAGKPHPIEYFDTIETVAADGTRKEESPVPFRQRRLSVFLFDLDSAPGSLTHARQAAVKAVEEGTVADSWAVATISRSGVRFVSAFTSDRVAVQRAIATLAPSRSKDPFGVTLLAAERSEVAGLGLGSEAGIGRLPGIAHDLSGGSQFALGTTHAQAAGEFVSKAVELEAIRQEAITSGFVENLTALADYLAPLEGVKQVILLSDRRSLADGFESIRRVAMLLHSRYRAAGVILNGVETGETRVSAVDEDLGSSLGSRAPSPARAFVAPLLYLVALDTGGVATTSLSQAVARNSRPYVIGFRAPAGRTKGSVRVRVRNVPRGTDVRYRKDYDLGLAKTANQQLFLADALLNDIPQNGVTLDLKVTGTEAVASIPGPELLAHANGQPLTLQVFLYVFNAEGQALSWRQMTIAVDPVKGREFLSTQPYTIRADLPLDPGTYVVKTLVRIGGTDHVGLARTDVVVP